ncbi:L-threonylcarbamoyladenylate synthase [Vagococcus xieshaowenii]|uniref:Threonylcarbamoyl-AMP synthase n=1 Tax=Vagococcus xieshaowenii TaxID=2562451 RepID=A0AAJ5EFL9_9ENTE|nr:L-threonylcarbamoyladenylate synthase [Vagococcus xieshaowenii]QCA28443.1 threonylcarbamoyl-AMP synthase [Vagococcus xieshaowenii]TFZ42801.1 threonylcarbamoyl-AMP synthase [Vagococcus xieshaowenii]
MDKGNKWTADDVSLAAKAIQEGELVAFPTETVYGLGADATNETAVKQVYAAKGRPSDNPLIVHIATQQDLTPFVKEISNEAKQLMKTFWPGPLTLIFEIKENSLPMATTGGLTTCAFRMPANDATLMLIRESGKVLVGPSANTSGKPSPTTADHVLHDLKEHIAGVIDDGQTRVGLESTVLDMTVTPPMILRPGAITPDDLKKVIDDVSVDQHLLSETSKPKAPGMKYRHYAPEVPVYMIDYRQQNWQEAITWAKSDNKKIGLLCSKELAHPFVEEVEHIFYLSQNSDVKESMHQLFNGLRYFDDKEGMIDIVFVETFADEGIGMAYMNRVRKSASQRYYR